MLDENLPTFRGKQSSTNPNNTLFSFTHHGSTPSPEFLLCRPDPASPESRNKYAIALADPLLADVIYAEVLVIPDYRTASASDGVSGGAIVPQPPDAIALNLYNPDQVIELRQVPGSWGRAGSWEFSMPTASFARPSASQIDREHAAPAADDLVPKLTFRWKRDRLSRSLTCFLVGKTTDGPLGRRGTREPDITVALAETGRNGAGVMAVYEPNMQRVEVEDRKGLDMLLLLSSEVICDLWLNPKDPYNLDTASTGGARGRRKSSKGATISSGISPSLSPAGTRASAGVDAGAGAGVGINASQAAPIMSGAVAVPRSASPKKMHRKSSPSGPQSQADIDAETERLRLMVEEEEKQRQERERAETERLKKMLQHEERQRREQEERQRAEFERTERRLRLQEEERQGRIREEEVEKETERLRKLYGVQAGPKVSSASGSGAPNLPPRPVSTGPALTAAPSSQYAQYFSTHAQQGYQEAPSGTAARMHQAHLAFTSKLEQLPLAGQAASTVSGLFNKVKQKGDKKVTKKRSL